MIYASRPRLGGVLWLLGFVQIAYLVLSAMVLAFAAVDGRPALALAAIAFLVSSVALSATRKRLMSKAQWLEKWRPT